MVELQFHPKCVTAHSKGRYVRAETVLEQQIDYFRDATDQAGELFSPTVYVEFEGQDTLSQAASAALGHSYTVTLPHCFNPEQ
eukprot:3718125-Prymnesium_polylepis.1